MTVLGCGRNTQSVETHDPPLQACIVNISLENASSNHLNWVELKWRGPNISGGIVKAGTTATILDIKWPNAPSATLTFIDYSTQKPYTIEVPLSVANGKVTAGGIQHVTFRILAYDKADIICE